MWQLPQLLLLVGAFYKISPSTSITGIRGHSSIKNAMNQLPTPPKQTLSFMNSPNFSASQFQHLFFSQLKSLPIDSVHLALESGYFISVNHLQSTNNNSRFKLALRLPSSQVELDTDGNPCDSADSPITPNTTYYALDAFTGQTTETIAPTFSFYDPRDQLWYRQAKHHQENALNGIWSDIYNLEQHNSSGITFSIPVISPTDGIFLGVVSADYALSSLSNVLEDNYSSDEKTFVFASSPPYEEIAATSWGADMRSKQSLLEWMLAECLVQPSPSTTQCKQSFPDLPQRTILGHDDTVDVEISKIDLNGMNSPRWTLAAFSVSQQPATFITLDNKPADFYYVITCCLLSTALCVICIGE